MKKTKMMLVILSLLGSFCYRKETIIGFVPSQISIGEFHSCALLDNGNVKCWGEGANGQLGQGNISDIGNAAGQMGDNLAPIELGTGRSAKAISTGKAHTCALLDDGNVKCWGNGSDGRLGQGNTNNIGIMPNQMGDNLSPITLGTGRSAKAIAAGETHTCTLLDDDSIKCWGHGSSGELGQGDTNNIGAGGSTLSVSASPPIDLGTGRSAKAISAGGNYTCALLDDNSIKCWGLGFSGRLGQGNTDNIGDMPNQMGDNLTPIDLGTGRSVRSITTGGNHSCALLDDNSVKCWGSGSQGQLGNERVGIIGDDPNEMGNMLNPTDLGSGHSARAITTGGNHSCALLDDGNVKCWGLGGQGRLGQNSLNTIGNMLNQMGDNLPPIDLGSGRSARAITAGDQHTCALLDDNSVKCWGSGSQGQLGQGNTNNIGAGSSTLSVSASPPIDL